MLRLSLSEQLSLTELKIIEMVLQEKYKKGIELEQRLGIKSSLNDDYKNILEKIRGEIEK